MAALTAGLLARIGKAQAQAASLRELRSVLDLPAAELDPLDLATHEVLTRGWPGLQGGTHWQCQLHMRRALRRAWSASWGMQSQAAC